MNKNVKELKNKTVKELSVELSKAQSDLAKAILSKKSSPAKDTNLIQKKKKQLARILTVLTEQNQLEKIKKI